MKEKIIVNKQSSIKIVGEKTVYFDPWEIEEKKDADIIFLTHNHYDHFSPLDIRKAMKEDTCFVLPQEMKEEFMKELSLSEENCIFVIPNMKITVKGISVITVPAYNQDKPFHPKNKNWCGYLIEMDHICYYIAGDTDGVEENSNIECDIAFLPIGGTYTMNISEAVAFSQKIKAKEIIPIHYGSVVGKIEDGRQFQLLLQKINPHITVNIKLGKGV